MTKFSIVAAAAALSLAAAAPAVAQDASADPFVSSQGGIAGMSTAAMVAAGVAVGIIAIAAIDAADDS